MTEKLYNAKRIDAKTIQLDSGHIIKGFHPYSTCLGEFCPVHKPSDHALRELPLDFNGVNMLRRIGEDEVTIDPDDYYFSQDEYAVITNKAKCLECNNVLESRGRHNFLECDCGNISVDGGYNYIRHSIKDPAKYKNLSIEMRKIA